MIAPRTVAFHAFVSGGHRLAAVLLLTIGGLALPPNAAEASPSSADATTLDVIGQIDLGAGFIVLSDRQPTSSDVFPEVPETIAYVEHQAFRGARTRTYSSTVGNLQVEATVVDLGNRRAVESTLHPVVDPITADRGPAPRNGRTSVELPSGRMLWRLEFGHGRMLVRIDASGPAAATSTATASIEVAHDQVRLAPSARDVSTTIGRDVFVEIFSQTVGALLVFYTLFGLVVVVRDQARRRRMLGPSAGASVVLPPTWSTSIGGLARRRRWRRRAAGAAFWCRQILVVLWLFAIVGAVAWSSIGLAVIATVGLVAIVARAIVRPRWRTHGSVERYRAFAARSVGARAATAIILLPVVASVVLSGVALTIGTMAIREPTVGSLAVFGLLALIVAAGSLSLVDREFASRRRAQVGRTVGEDHRPPVLLLRSFEDDDLRVRVRRGAQHGLLGRLSLRRYDRFEEVVAWTGWQFGPVVAIGEPGRVGAPLGAARDYVADDGWRSHVAGLIDGAGLILIVLGNTPGVLEEIDHLRHRGALGRTVFVIPPISDEETRTRLQLAAAHLGVHLPLVGARAGDGEVHQLLLLDHAGRLHFVTGRFADDVSYETALEWAASVVGARPNGHVAPAAPLSRPPLLEPPVPGAARLTARVTLRCLPFVVAVAIALLFTGSGALDAYVFLRRFEEPIRPPSYLPGLGAAPTPDGFGAGDGWVASYDARGRIWTMDLEGSGNGVAVEVGGFPTAVDVSAQLVAAADLDRDLVTVFPPGDDVPSTLRSFDVDDPIAVAVHGQRVAVASAASHSVELWDLSNREPTRVSSAPIGGTPTAVDFDGDSIAVNDIDHDRVIVVGTDGTVMTSLGVPRGPRSVVLRDGEVDVVSELEPAISSFSRSGDLIHRSDVGVSPTQVATIGTRQVIVDRGRQQAIVLDRGVVAGYVPAGHGAEHVAFVGDYLLLATSKDTQVGLYPTAEVDDHLGPEFVQRAGIGP